jgi:hypothetical protein
MATMIPSDNEYFKTDGERRFYRFLENVAKPDAQHIVWYLPDIKGEEPDFLLFCEKIGLVIFEVKDWALSQIKNFLHYRYRWQIWNQRQSLSSGTPLFQNPNGKDKG